MYLMFYENCSRLIAKFMAAPQPPNTSPRHLTPPQLRAFINLLAEHRKDGKAWAVAHVKLMGGENGLAEMRQLLDHAFQKSTMWTMSAQATRELVMLTDNARQNVHQIVDMLVREHCAPGTVRTMVAPLGEKGILQIQPVLSGMIGAGDQASRLGLVRLARMANVFLVLDDDPMMLRQMEHMLKAFGHVETCSAASEFLERYFKYAPNVAFVDIHLRAENGAAMTGALVDKVDPYAHVIMISADAVKDNIRQSRTNGAKGFLAKPISREQLFRYLLSAPTFVPRQS